MILKLNNGFVVFMAQYTTIFTNPFHFTGFTVVEIGRLRPIPIVCITVHIDLNRYSLNTDILSRQWAYSLVDMSLLAVDQELIWHLALNSDVHLWADRFHVWEDRWELSQWRYFDCSFVCFLCWQDYLKLSGIWNKLWRNERCWYFLKYVAVYLLNDFIVCFYVLRPVKKLLLLCLFRQRIHLDQILSVFEERVFEKLQYFLL